MPAALCLSLSLAAVRSVHPEAMAYIFLCAALRLTNAKSQKGWWMAQAWVAQNVTFSFCFETTCVTAISRPDLSSHALPVAE